MIFFSEAAPVCSVRNAKYPLYIVLLISFNLKFNVRKHFLQVPVEKRNKTIKCSISKPKLF